MTPITLPAPGLHYGVSYEDYARWPAVNFSRLKAMRKSAATCRYQMDNPKKKTLSMILGSCLHVSVLEPAQFENLFFICPPCDRKTTDGKAIYAKAVQDAAGREIIRDGTSDGEKDRGEVARVRNMARAVLSSRAFRPFLEAPGQNEVCAVWFDKETDQWCKARLDRFIPHFELFGIPVIVEIKSTKDAQEWSFGKDCHSLGYAGQAGCYRAAIKAITGKEAAHVIFAVENDPPHLFQTHMLDDQSLQTGLLQYREMLSRYAECERTGTWPGYEDKVNRLSLPKYAHLEAA